MASVETKTLPHIIVNEVPPEGLELDTESEDVPNNSGARQGLNDTTDEMSVAQHHFQHLLFRATLSFLAPFKDVPSNCNFLVQDAEAAWDFPHQFDYIHGRALAACFKSHLTVFKSAFSALRPGGYLELQDLIIPFHSIDDSHLGTKVEEWSQRMIDGSAALGSDVTRVAKYRQYLEEAGFEAVVETRYVWPVGTWAKGQRMKMLGELYREDLLSMVDSFAMAVMTAGLGMKPEEIRELLREAKEGMRSNKVHIYIPMLVIYGRKPSSEQAI